MEFQRTSPFFVETKGYIRIKHLLDENHIIVVKGNPGDGKTSFAMHVMFDLMKQGKRPLQIHDYKEFDKYVSPNRNLIIFIDNLFGEFSVSKDDVAQWSNRFQALQAVVCDGDRRNYIVIAIRKDIYNESRKFLKSEEFLESNSVDISKGSKFGLNSEEMRQMFTNYTELSIPESNFSDSLPNLGFPQCCRLYRDTKELRNEGLMFFKNPLNFLIKELQLRLNGGDMKIAVLVFILLQGGAVPNSILCDNSKNKELKFTSMEICLVDKDFVKFQRAIDNNPFATTVQINNAEVVTFSHSSVQNALFLVVGKLASTKLMQHCDFRLLSMITTSKCRSQKIECLQIPDSCIPVVCERIRKLLKQQICSSGLLKVLSELYIWNDPFVIQTCLKFKRLFSKVTDEEHIPLLVYFSAVGCIEWVKHLLIKKTSGEQAFLALKMACGANELSVVKFIISKGCTPNIECCFNAIKGGHLDVIFELEKSGVDLTETCETQTRWSTKTSVLDEAAMQNQCHLIEPLLQKCPDLIRVKSSIGATPLHFVAEAGDVALLKKIIELPRFTPYDMAYNGSTILHFACQNNKYEAVKYIIDTYPFLFSETYYCYSQGTILHTAAQSGNAELFQYVFRQNEKLLEENKLDLLQLSRGNHVITNKTKQTSISRSMILHVRNVNNFTVLHSAVCSQSIDMVKFIVSQGLNFTNCSKDGDLSVGYFMHAQAYTDNDEMVSFLKNEYNITPTYPKWLIA